MRPVRLTFSGLRSYRAETVVDFSALDLFAVIGDTGAGKSTLIEALCLALYARKSWTGGEAGLSDMISDGVNTMRIELVFTAGGHEWVVTRARHRNSSAPIDKLVSTTGGTGADGAKAVTARVAELIGLSYEQFTRAVVLPQGRFDSLLRATRAQRNEILTSILDLGDVAATKARAESLRREWEPRVVEWRTRREQYPHDPVAAVAATDAAAQRAADLDARLGAAVAEVADLQAQVSTDAEARADVRRALDAVSAHSLDSSAAAGVAAPWDAVEAEATTAAAERQAAAARLAELTTTAADLLRGANGRDDLVGAGRDLRSVVTDLPGSLAELDAATSALAELMAAAPSPDGTANPAIDRAAAEAESAVAMAEAERRAADEALMAARVAYRGWVDARTTAESAAAAVAELDGRIANGEGVVAASADAAAVASEARRAAVAAEHAALRADAAATAATGCAPGDPCPVCERELPDTFVAPASGDDVETARTAREAADAAAQAADEQLARHRAQMDKLDGERSAARAAAEAATTALAVAIERAQAAGVDLALDVTSDLASDDAEAAALVGPQTAVTAAAERVDGARVRRDEAVAAQQRDLAERRAAVDAHRRDVEVATERVDRARGVVDRLRTRLGDLPGEWGASLTPEPGPDELALLADSLDAAVAALSDVDADRIRTEAALRTADQQIADSRRRLVDEVRRPLEVHATAARAHVTSTSALAAALAAATPSDEDADEGEHELAAPEPPAAREDLDRFVADLHHLETVTADLTAQATGRLADLDGRVAEVERRVASVLADHGAASVVELQHQHGVASSELRHARQAHAEAREQAAAAALLDERLAVAAPFVADLTVLDVALRNQHFVAHLVDARERELLAEASRRLKDITGGRFGFVAEFGIVDVRSGEVRSPDTLSGGERFQAALALALALVEIASRGAGKLDAVFVDEGFGSLDHQALDVALATLGSVAGGGKMVALISHLRPVAEFVDDVLLVTKDEMGGSRIELLDADARDDMLADDIRSGLTV